MKNIKNIFVFTSVVMLLMAANVNGGERELSQEQDFEEARKIIQQVYEISVSERYSEYEKYFQAAQKKISELMDRGVPHNQAFKDVKGKLGNERIENIKQFFIDQGLKERIGQGFNRYRETIKRVFAEFNLSSDLYGFIPWRESQFNPHICTTATVNGRNETVKGLWQFVESTGSEMGLKVSSTPCAQGMGESSDLQNDERFDVSRSTRAAAGYLSKIIEKLGSYGDRPELVLASFHNGPDAVAGMIKEFGPDYWKWELSERNQRLYGFGVKSYDYVPYVMAAAAVAKEE